MEKCLTHAVVNEYDEIAHICELYKYKMANSELPKLKKIIPRYYKPRTPASKKMQTLDFNLRIPVDTRSPIPVISVQSVGDLQYRWQS